MQQSPCVRCDRRNKDKNICVGMCQRIHVFRKGGPWKLYPIPAEKELEKEAKQIDDAANKLLSLQKKKPPSQRRISKKKEQSMPKPEQAKADMQSQTVETLPESQVIVDLSAYPQLRDAVFTRAQKLLLTPSHILITLAAEALAAGRQ
jgi:hypothetical protein